MSSATPESTRDRLFATWRSPASFTALIPITRFSEDEMRALLLAKRAEIEAALPTMTDLHSFRLVLVPATAPGVTRLHLLLNLVHDRPLSDHLDALLAQIGPALAAVLAGAENFTATEDLSALLQRYRVSENTVHLGSIHHALTDIRLEQTLREEIGEFADRALAEGRWNSTTPAEAVRRDIQAHVRTSAGVPVLPTEPSSKISRLGRVLRFLDLVATFLFPAMGVLSVDIADAIRRIASRHQRGLARIAYGFWWIYGAIPTGIAYLVVRGLELTEADATLPAADPAKVDLLEAAEDVRLKNEVTYWFEVRDSWIRRALIGVVLWGSERGCRHFWTDGKLAGIDTIHSARILLLNGKRVMLFMSDYDGSLDRYLLDFMGVGSRAVIPIASNVAGSPKTRWLYGQDDQGTFGPRLRNLLRFYQLEAAVWYNAYPDLAVRDVLINRTIRDGLFTPTMSPAAAQAWADLL